MQPVGRSRYYPRLTAALIALALATGCLAPAIREPLLVAAVPLPAAQVTVPLPTPTAGHARVSVLQAALAPPGQSCEDAFVTHQLDHVTTVPGNTVDQFETNGAGVAIGDLDDDGLPDVVLANDAGPNTILWNQGGLRFQAERLPHGDSRAVSLVDVDGDDLLDIVFSRRTGALTFWRNLGPQSTPQSPNTFPSLSGLTLQQQVLPGISKPAYALNWADLDHDGDLDLVTGSYDASLLNDLGNSFLLHGGGGVWIYENKDGRFSGSNLAPSAQAMAVMLFDMNRDGLQDIVVGNDFGLPDYAWLDAGGSWQPARFDTTSHSTMSMEVGDVDNDGIPELFSTDMMPYAEDPATVSAWEPIMAGMIEDKERGDPQIMSNVLQVYTGVTGYQNAARPRGVDASGWSWSSKFGDLDQDGLLDLYVVNGFIESTMFAHLPNHELVEENQALRNIGDGYFRPAPQWGLASTASGRGMSMADLDGDGDLDVVVNNLRSPAQLFENRLCGGDSLQVELRWPGSGNSRAIGAVMTLHTSAGPLTRDVRAVSGYLSGDPSHLHFGFPRGTVLDRLEILWPDGARTVISGVEAATLLTVTRNRVISSLPEELPGTRTTQWPHLTTKTQMHQAGRFSPLVPWCLGGESPANLALAVQGCGGGNAPAQANPSPSPLDVELRAVITAHELTGDPSTERDLPSIDDPLAQLGKKLFFSKALSGDMDVACASCHHPLLGGGDNLAVSIGVGAVQPDVLGPGRVHNSSQPNVGRNALTTFNVGLWDQAMFWDGRVESLGRTPGQNGADGQGIRTPDSYLGDADPRAGDNLVSAQSRFPPTSVSEMRGHTFEHHKPNEYVRLHLSGRLGDYGPGQGELPGNSWLAEFQKALRSRGKAEELINDANLAAVLGAYQRSQVFVHTPWRAYVQGDNGAIDAQAKQGALLFLRTVDQGGASCAQCHAGDFFTDEQYHVLAVPQVGPGKDDGTYQDDDYGRFRETGRPQDLYAFRTPTLVNVAVTGPYGHDGAYATLKGIVRHHLNPARAVEAYDAGQLDPSVQTAGMAYNTARSLAKLEENRRLGLPAIQDIDLTDAQVEALVAFLHALTDPCVLDPACLAPWLPGQGEADPDGLRLDGQLPAQTPVP